MMKSGTLLVCRSSVGGRDWSKCWTCKTVKGPTRNPESFLEPRPISLSPVQKRVASGCYFTYSYLVIARTPLAR